MGNPLSVLYPQTIAACPEAEVQALSAAIVAGKGESHAL